jgi:hypothetical protein
MRAESEGRPARRFRNVRESKEFLVGEIVAEAARESVPISETERKMLYFSETGWTLPEMAEVNASFDREYDQGDYEEKITRLVQSHLRRKNADDKRESEDWNAAVEKLSGGDHYLLVMIGAASRHAGDLSNWLPVLSRPYPWRPLNRRRGDRLRLWIVAAVCILGLCALLGLLGRFFG